MLERAVAVTAAASCVTSSRWDTEEPDCLATSATWLFTAERSWAPALSVLAQNQDANASFLFLFEVKIGEIHTPMSDTW